MPSPSRRIVLPDPPRVVVLVSGSGTLLQALLDARPAEIVAVGADRPGIAGLERAERAGVPTFVERVGDHPDRPAWDAALAAWGVPADQFNSRSAALPTDGGTGPRLFFQQVPEGKTSKNRMHLDVRAAPGLKGDERMTTLETEAGRLVGLGATRVRRVEPDSGMEQGFLVMQDPEGNEFCLD